MGGKGAFYKAKYGGGGKGGGKGSRGDSDAAPQQGAASGGDASAHEDRTHQWQASSLRRSGREELTRRLHSLDGRQYPCYRDIEGFSYSFQQGYDLVLDKAQTDPYAAPSKMRVCLSSALADYSYVGLGKKIRRVALADILCRKFWEGVHHMGLDEVKQQASYHAAKGGELNIERPSQHIVERSSVTVSPSGEVEVRFQLSLPARGRTILGAECARLMCDTLHEIILSTLPSASLQRQEVMAHVNSAEDQEHLRAHLADYGLIAFVANGSTLPRRGGDDDRPMEGKRGSDTRPVLFHSPKSMEVAVSVPHRGEIRGMGVRPGITLIVGGGFHGKSTLLRALEVGVYNHIPGDGREFVTAVEDAAKIRAEDKRCVGNVDISCFLNNLPKGKRTDTFSTQDASGSTSQASNIMEALEVGTKAILIDEDTCATNFMIRDYRMQLLVQKEKEPITPFILKVRQLYNEFNTSAICVVGGAGAYLEVADAVVMMDSYEPRDVTAEAHAIVEKIPNSMSEEEKRRESGESFGRVASRAPAAAGVRQALGDRAKVFARGVDTLAFGGETIDLSFVEQLVEKGQVAAIGDYIQAMAPLMDGRRSLRELLDLMESRIDADPSCGLDAVKPGWLAPVGTYTRPRPLEVASALNRLRTMQFSQK